MCTGSAMLRDRIVAGRTRGLRRYVRRRTYAIENFEYWFRRVEVVITSFTAHGHLICLSC